MKKQKNIFLKTAIIIIYFACFNNCEKDNLNRKSKINSCQDIIDDVKITESYIKAERKGNLQKLNAISPMTRIADFKISLDKKQYKPIDDIIISVEVINNKNEEAVLFPYLVSSLEKDCMDNITFTPCAEWIASNKKLFDSLKAHNVEYDLEGFCIKKLDPKEQINLHYKIHNKCSPGKHLLNVYLYGLGSYKYTGKGWKKSLSGSTVLLKEAQLQFEVSE